MAGLVPAIHVLPKKTWMPGTRPGMTRSLSVDSQFAGYFLVQCPNRAKDDGPLEMPPVSAPFSSDIVAFQVS